MSLHYPEVPKGFYPPNPNWPSDAPVYPTHLTGRAVRRLMRVSGFDTQTIARWYGLPESLVYNMLARTDGEAA